MTKTSSITTTIVGLALALYGVALIVNTMIVY
jgi:hypothetical protein